MRDCSIQARERLPGSMFDGSDYSDCEDEDEFHERRTMKYLMEEEYEAKYRPEVSKLRPSHCRTVRNRTHPGKNKPRREYLIHGKWYPAQSLPQELRQSIEDDRADEVTSDEDASSDEEPAINPLTDRRELARREAERKSQARRAEKANAKWRKQMQVVEAARKMEELQEEARRRAELTEEERVAEDERARLAELYYAGGYYLDPRAAHEAAVAAGDASHVAADDEYYRWTIPELKELLDANDQLKGGTKAVLVARCADGKLYGGLPRCPQCGGGKLKVCCALLLALSPLASIDFQAVIPHSRQVAYKKAYGHGGRGGYRCPGYYDDDEYVNCDFVGIDVLRAKWKEDEDVVEVPAPKRAKVDAPAAAAKAAQEAAAKVVPPKAAVKTAKVPTAATRVEEEVAGSPWRPRRSASSRVRTHKTLVRWAYNAERRRFSTTSGELRMVPVQLVTKGDGAIVEFEGGKFAKLGAPAPGQLPLVSL